jgi:hypothetical protein
MVAKWDVIACCLPKLLGNTNFIKFNKPEYLNHLYVTLML